MGYAARKGSLIKRREESKDMMREYGLSFGGLYFKIKFLIFLMQ